MSSLTSNIGRRTKKGGGGEKGNKAEEGQRALDAKREELAAQLASIMIQEIHRSQTLGMMSYRGDDGSVKGDELAAFLENNLRFYPPPTSGLVPSSDPSNTGVCTNVILLYGLWRDRGLKYHYVRDPKRGHTLRHQIRFRLSFFDHDTGLERSHVESVALNSYPNARALYDVLSIRSRMPIKTREEECVVLDASHSVPRVPSDEGIRRIWCGREMPSFRLGYCVSVSAMLSASSPLPMEAGPLSARLRHHDLFVRPTLRCLTRAEFVRACNAGLRSLGVTDHVVEDAPRRILYTPVMSAHAARPLEDLVFGARAEDLALGAREGYIAWETWYTLVYEVRATGPSDEAPKEVLTVIACDYHGKETLVAYQGDEEPEPWALRASLRKRLFVDSRMTRVASMDHPLLAMEKGRAGSIAPAEDPLTNRMRPGLSLDNANTILVYRSKLIIDWYNVIDEREAPYYDADVFGGDAEAGKLRLAWDPRGTKLLDLLDAFLESAGPGYARHPEDVRFYALGNTRGTPDFGRYIPIITDEDVRTYIVQPWEKGPGLNAFGQEAYKLMVSMANDQVPDVDETDDLPIKGVMQNFAVLNARLRDSREKGRG